jgi:hypothetical protein
MININAVLGTEVENVPIEKILVFPKFCKTIKINPTIETTK